MTIGHPSLTSNRLLASSQQRRLTSRPKGVYEKQNWRDTQAADDDTMTLSTSGSSEQSNRSVPASSDPITMAVNCTSPALLAANFSNAYKNLHFQCESELYDVKHTLTQPLEEIVDSVKGLFNAEGFLQLSRVEHVAELRQKAAWMGRVRVGPKNRPRKVRSGRNSVVTVVNENCVTTSNEGPGRRDRKEAYECVFQSASENASREVITVTNDNNSPAHHDPHERGKVLVKARWINNYHKYHEVKKKKEQLENFHSIKKTSPKRLARKIPNKEDIPEQKAVHRQKRPIKESAPQISCCSERSDMIMRQPGKYGERSRVRLPATSKGKPTHKEHREQGGSTAKVSPLEYQKSAKPLQLSPSITDDITKKLQNIITNFQAFHP
jgi:hypothetical protein